MEPDWPLRLAAKELKQFTDGGCLLSENELAEIVFGESGCGKTQLALYLTACTLATGCCGAVYVSTESLFPIDRFVQLLDRYFPPYGPQSRQQMLDNLHLEHAYDLDVQWHVLRYQLPRLLQLCAERRNGAGQHPIRLLVIDSIAANYRYGLEDGDNDEGDGDDQENDGKLLLLGNKISTAARRKKAAYRRNRQLHQLGAWLKHLSYRYGMTVLALNQVTTTVSPDYQNDMTAVNSDCFSLQPALGQTWTACVNTRLMLTRSSCGPARIAEVVFAPHLPRRRKLRFHLLPDGSIQFEYDVETTASDINC